MKNKKQYPLALLQALEGFVNLKGDKFEITEPGDFLLKVMDKDPNSDFYFILESHQITPHGVMQVLMNQKPYRRESVNNKRTWINVSDLKKHFNSWLALLDEYDTVNSFFDDPILKAFTDEFYTEFEILEDDADIKPLNTSQILLLDAHLEEMSNKLSTHITERNELQIKDIQNDIEILRGNLTSKSKQWVATNAAKIWAKIAKQGPVFIKEFLSEVRKEIIKQAVKGVMELAQNYI